MNNKQFSVTVRARGQITVPDNLRKKTFWLREGTPVTLIEGIEEIKITPLRIKEGDGLNWRKLWQQITLIRHFSGKKGNLSSFIASDRAGRI
ncbi:MAG: hypothetical protein UV73_C0018G0028 [Candidatus Gottesmanbacteria bacterium GW2011_GWA2_43_14]|uniref:SpoVT-AbrB domain-containing protein n=1 Tax=Candidatus Gottesmanbacteria bacterium GW2011_GWA2_43_14 TaxID=1618443 RepID=A0A0G1DBZ8_9BACT|nr:MAG: hypothetical protein UV73_C0018G0028 [Candidatus Gottesmanbacteria bacterium GW2011_GWA2_43_14]